MGTKLRKLSKLCETMEPNPGGAERPLVEPRSGRSFFVSAVARMAVVFQESELEIWSETSTSTLQLGMNPPTFNLHHQKTHMVEVFGCRTSKRAWQFSLGLACNCVCVFV